MVQQLLHGARSVRLTIRLGLLALIGVAQLGLPRSLGGPMSGAAFAGLLLVASIALSSWRDAQGSGNGPQRWIEVALAGAVLSINPLWGAFALGAAALPVLLVAASAWAALAGAGAVGLVWVVSAVGFQSAQWFLGRGVLGRLPWLPLVCVPLVYAVTRLRLRHIVSRVRQNTRQAVEGELSRMRQTARSYRLEGFAEAADDRAVEAPPTSAAPVPAVAASIEHLHVSLHFVLRLLSENLGLRTVALLFASEEEPEKFGVREVVTDCRELLPRPIEVQGGVLAAATSTRAPVLIDGSKARGRFPLYAEGVEPTAIGAVPLIEDGAVTGILLIDMQPGRTLGDVTLHQLSDAADFVLRAIQAERLLLQIDRAKKQQTKLYQAAQALAKARTENEVIRAGVESARRFTSFDFAAVTLYDADRREHEICAASGPDSELLAGATFGDNGSLVSLVVETRHSLPYRGEFYGSQQVVFDATLSAPQLSSLLILPLFVHESVLGTLILGSQTAGMLGEDVRPTLEVLAQQVAVSLANARMVKRLADLATTDGLTGHLNKRALLEVAQQKICSASRFAKPLSVIVGDIDLFKRVNDTFGHDVGDVVIRGFGNVLRRTKRETDAVGRFGGEEFVLVCEETDATGARLLAERIRQELGATVFHTEQGPLQITCSLGVATMPVAGTEWDQLFKAADEALYAAKRGGRNRVSVWTPGVRAAVA